MIKTRTPPYSFSWRNLHIVFWKTMCKLTNPRLQCNSLKIHFQPGLHLGNHQQSNIVERKQRKQHQETTSKLQTANQGGRGGGKSVQKQKNECNCWPWVWNLASPTMIHNGILGPNHGTLKMTQQFQIVEEVFETQIGNVWPDKKSPW